MVTVAGPAETAPPLPVRAHAPPTEATVVLHHAARAMFGATALVTEIVVRTLTDSAPAGPDNGDRPVGADELVDGLLGLGWGTAHAADRLAAVATGALSLALDPPLVPRALRPVRLLERVSLNWQAERADAVRSLAAWSMVVAPAASDVVVKLVDVDQLLLTALRRVNLQQLAEAALAELDVEEVTSQTLDRVDLTALVLERVDLPRVVDSVLDQMDLTDLVLERVDLVKVAETVVEGIDLPGLVRESTGSMASETMTGIRMQGVEADRAVSRLVDRVLQRRRDDR